MSKIYATVWEAYIADTVSIKDTKKGVLFMARKKKEIKTENIEVMSLGNKPINNDIQKEEVKIPKQFVKMPDKKIEHQKIINTNNGRVYKKLANGYAMYADDGSVFKLEG